MHRDNKRVEQFRRIVAVIAAGVTVYYLYWRITETFNPNALFFSWSLYGAEFFGALTTFLFFFMVWKPLSRTAPPPIPNRAVDILIPTKNEPIHVLRKTLLACNDLKYPHRTLVLDDGSRPEVKALCEELKCIYLARISHEHAKAGNLNFGLLHTNAEFIVVFDADHAPLPHFIDRIIGYFQDEKVAFVQTPQEFYNIDSFQHRTDPKKKYIWGEQYLFFSLIQPGKDYWKSAYFVGSCALLRRKALEDIGGFATGSITEDLMTSIRIHAKGWSSVYHNENLAYGIAAETLLPFHIQRQRWAIGGWQVFFKANPLFVRGLSIPQRLNYLASMIYPVEGFQKLIFYATPPIALFTGILPMRALDVNYLLHFIPYYAISLFAFNEMARGYGGNIMLEQFSMGKFATYIKTFGIFLFSKKSSQFKVTPKGGYSLSPYRFIIPQMAVFLISITAITWALVELLLEMRNDDFIVVVNCLWALYNSGLGLAIIQYDYKKLFQRREDFRIPNSVLVYYSYISQDKTLKRFAVADNITKKGLSLLSIGQIPIGQKLTLEIMLPKKTMMVNGTVTQEKSITAEGYPISRVGILFTELSKDEMDTLARYLSESAVVKFMKEYSTRYRTYLERRFMTEKHFQKRAYRALAYLPVIVHAEDEKPSYGVVKDISESGFLLATSSYLSSGSRLAIEIILGKDTFLLKGIVVRNLTHESEDFPEFLAGIYFIDTPSQKVTEILKIADKIGDLVIT